MLVLLGNLQAWSSFPGAVHVSALASPTLAPPSCGLPVAGPCYIGWAFKRLAKIDPRGCCTACATTPPPCNSPTTKNLSAAIEEVQYELLNGCEAEFDRYYDELLTIAD